MNAEFWQSKWEKNEIGFHLSKIHPMLQRYESYLPKPPARVFVPLCGKTLDIQYLLSCGYEVVANELSEKAVKQLFLDMDAVPQVSEWEFGRSYSVSGLTVWVGDFFQLKQALLGEINVVYDRAALIALPNNMREKYSAHLGEITKYAPQLLISLNYDQSQMPGPPFAVDKPSIQKYYEDKYEISQLSSKNIIEHESKFASKGLTAFYEDVYYLQPKGDLSQSE